VTSGGTNFNDFPNNEITKFGFFIPPSKHHTSFPR